MGSEYAGPTWDDRGILVVRAVAPRAQGRRRGGCSAPRASPRTRSPRACGRSRGRPTTTHLVAGARGERAGRPRAERPQRGGLRAPRRTPSSRPSSTPWPRPTPCIVVPGLDLGEPPVGRPARGGRPARLPRLRGGPLPGQRPGGGAPDPGPAPGRSSGASSRPGQVLKEEIDAAGRRTSGWGSTPAPPGPTTTSSRSARSARRLRENPWLDRGVPDAPADRWSSSTTRPTPSRPRATSPTSSPRGRARGGPRCTARPSSSPRRQALRALADMPALHRGAASLPRRATRRGTADPASLLDAGDPPRARRAGPEPPRGTTRRRGPGRALLPDRGLEEPGPPERLPGRRDLLRRGRALEPLLLPGLPVPHGQHDWIEEQEQLDELISVENTEPASWAGRSGRCCRSTSMRLHGVRWLSAVGAGAPGASCRATSSSGR